MSEVLRDTIALPVRTEIEVTRSRFVADLVPVTDLEAAAAVVAGARREFHDARHHCSAWILGPEGGQTRSNDDGEPSGTAGAPMLAVLDGAELTDVVAVVTRYFGGTLLGAGGLVRAYGQAVSTAVQEAVRVARQLVVLIEVRAPHAEAGRVEHHLRRHVLELGGWLDGVTYDAPGACFRLALPDGAEAQLVAALAGGGLPHELAIRGHAVRDERRR
ncbi:IMPACT family protein [Nitriliruptor alkaliphilus]|uniref:IMPACT family protein n=1 Tax=Nitriliruptor alkaliphilus TaxID=427918 RepID=UPI00069750DE|nr:YigZ family protein [Nitriliruptor alkaliphilus]